MKTVKQIADAMGVSKTTIENRIKKLNIQKIHGDDNRRTALIAEADAVRIMDDINPQADRKTDRKTDNDQPQTNRQEPQNTTNQPPRTEADTQLIELLMQENDNKQRMIDALLQDKEVLNTQLLLLQTQIAELKALPPMDAEVVAQSEEPAKPSKGFFARLFGSK